MPTMTPTSPETLHRAAWKAGVMGALNLIVAVVAVRIILLIAVGGAIWLTYLALQAADPMRLVALGVFCVTVVIPSVWLAVVR